MGAVEVLAADSVDVYSPVYGTLTGTGGGDHPVTCRDDGSDRAIVNEFGKYPDPATVITVVGRGIPSTGVKPGQWIGLVSMVLGTML